MYEEIVESSRFCAMGYNGACDGCIFCGKSNYKDGDCYQQLHKAAADAIEALNGKATPKHVGFSSWKGYRNTRYKCPYCNKNVRNDEAYCHKCGQALMFPRISFIPYVPGETQEVIIEWPDEPPKEE